MKLGNVLVIGNSGVGKSTLINAVLGEDAAEVSWGRRGTTELEIYETDGVPFRMIDTIGFEPSPLLQNKAINAVKDWAKASAKAGRQDTQINLIWFCVDGVSKRLFASTIDKMAKATSLYKSVPVVVVITKSYSDVEREQNVAMVQQVFASLKKHRHRLRAVVPVVAEAYPVNNTMTIPPSGIDELIEVTNQLLPEGVRAAEADIDNFILKRRRQMAQGVIWPSIAAGVVVGASPIPVADAAVLGGLEAAMIKSIAKVYDIERDDKSAALFETIVEVGTVSAVAKGVISALKAIPGINVAAEVLNAVVAGSIVAALGEGCAYVFEKMYTGERDVNDIEWVRKLMEAQLSGGFVDKATQVLKQLAASGDMKSLPKAIFDAFGPGAKS